MLIKTGIVGAAGYTAGELFRILLHHPDVEIVFAQSGSNAGNPVSVVHDDLIGETDLVFSENANLQEVDVVFLCMGHGKSKSWMEENELPPNLKVIDLSTDYRKRANDKGFVYGLPEINRNKIKSAKYLANPGCFATGIQLALLPLAAAGLIKSDLHVQAITGSTGAGQQATATTHFSWRANNISAYNIFNHRHQDEIIETLKQLQPGYNQDFSFIPVRGNHTRGIFVTAYTQFDGTEEDARKLYRDYYASHPFVVLSETNPAMKQVVNSNKAIVYLEKHGKNLVIITLTDNLLKGASGQAVQNMNLMFGLDEKTGLKLKNVAF